MFCRPLDLNHVRGATVAAGCREFKLEGPGIMRITKRTNIAIRVLMFCGANESRLVTKSEIAARCNTSESHLAQVINQLAQLGFLHTQRGRSGGIASRARGACAR